VNELSKLGAQIEEMPDGMVIHGGVELKGATVDSHRDHRLAMTLGVAGLVAEGRTTIRDAGAVAVSYPGFWEDLKQLSHSQAG
jgi:3-phosphoshikimate 1-carboxyvinyltransferase